MNSQHSQQLTEENHALRQELATLRQQLQQQQQDTSTLQHMLEERHQLQNELEHAKRHWESTFDAIHDPIFLHDDQGHVLRANLAYAKIAGKPFHEILHRPYWHSFPQQEKPLPGCIRNTSHGCTTVTIPFETNGQQFLSFSYPVADLIGDKECAVHVLQNVTSQQQTHQKLRHRTDELHQTLQATVHAVAKAMEMRDPYTAGHQRRVGELGQAIGHKLRLDSTRCEGIYYGGIIHDIGKIHIPAEILCWPGRLSPLQYALVQEHPNIGLYILSGIHFPWPVADIVHQHHERLDGSGYPQGLAQDDITLEARIIAVADVVDAMTTHRPYRAGLGIELALEEILRGRKQLYEADAVDACVELFRHDGFQLKK